jgi:hypothetical protein
VYSLPLTISTLFENNPYEALETGEISLKDLAPRIHQLRHRQEQLEATRDECDALSRRKTELADLRLVLDYAEDLRSLLMNSSLAKRKAFIRSFVEEVGVTADEVTIKYKLPLPSDSLIPDKAGVLSIVQLGSGSWIRTNGLRVMSPTSFHCSIPRCSKLLAFSGQQGEAES